MTDKKKKKKKRSRVEVEVQEGAHLTITDKTPAGITVTPEANAAASAVPVLGHQEGQVTGKFLFKGTVDLWSYINA